MKFSRFICLIPCLFSFLASAADINKIKTVILHDQIFDLNEGNNRCITLTFPEEPNYTTFISGSQDGTTYALSAPGKAAPVITTKNDFSPVLDDHDYNFDQLARLNLAGRAPGLTSFEVGTELKIASKTGDVSGAFMTVLRAPEGVHISGKIINVPYASFRNSSFNAFIVPENLKNTSAIQSLKWTSKRFTYQEGEQQFSSVLSVVLPKDNLPTIDFQNSRISMTIWNIDQMVVCFN